MKKYEEMSRDELQELHNQLSKEYKDFQSQNLTLNMARGKPAYDQLCLSKDMLDIITSKTNFDDCQDYLNYGILDGIPEAKRFFAEMLETDSDHIIVYGNSSLNIMFDQISRGYTHGYMGETPWCKLDKIKFLCPVPGYDRHFAITERFGFEMINIPLLSDGPDMNLVEEYVQNDPAIKGIWCVPQYANPTGVVYSDEVVKRFANLKPAAKDFRIFWDNAYLVHHLYDDQQSHVYNIIKACEDAGNPDIVFEFCSTSKVSFPGSGVAAMATSPTNKKDILAHMTVQTIGYDKINELRHIQYFKNIDGLKDHMRKQADVLRPKFDTVLKIFDQKLEGLGIGTWTHPLGGYFITYTTLDGCAKEVIKKCKEAGAILTSAGAPYPYGKDPHDAVIRIAPSYPVIEELIQATNLLVLCIQLTSIEKYLSK